MPIIAMIDDRINKEYIEHPERIMPFSVDNGKIVKKLHNFDSTEITHSTICTYILESLAEDYLLVQIQILSEENSLACIDDMTTALRFCLQMQVDIISLSIGTTRLSDCLKLKPIIRKLTKEGVVIVAAHSNEGYITLPAAFPEVIGVKSDGKGLINPSEICVLPRNPLGIDIAANCRLDISNGVMFYYPSNSFAVPVAVARINEYMHTHIKTMEQIKNALLKDSVKDEKTTGALMDGCYKEIGDTQVPCVFIRSQKRIRNKQILELINFLFKAHQTEAICIADHKKTNDIRFIDYGVVKTGGHFLQRNCYANTDLIIFCLGEKNFSDVRKNITPDIIIEVGENSMRFIVDGNTVKQYDFPYDPQTAGDAIVTIFEEYGERN